MATAVVTGAASGVGRALARHLASEGYYVHLVDVADTRDLAAEVGGRPAQVDVSDTDQMEEVALAASDARLICLNAGNVGQSLGPAWEVPDDEWRRLLDVNVLGVVNGLRAFVPALLASEQPAQRNRELVQLWRSPGIDEPGDGRTRPTYRRRSPALDSLFSLRGDVALRHCRISRRRSTPRRGSTGGPPGPLAGR